ncbi:MAG: hypothetical protein KBT39_02740 [Bacteroidales bacterium]|nr:hypothetical protein [Bacteroidales bacterium]
MKKVLFMSAIAAAALASCTSDEYVGQVGQTLTESINFGTSAQKTTRAGGEFTHGAAAEKLNNNFIVYGFKTASDEVTSDGDQPVFQLYNVNYTEGTANTTESNTAGWEYVGLANHDNSVNPQTIKYWDLSANSYVFSAVSGVGITATKILAGSVGTNYEKGWNVTIPAGGDLSSLYASNRVVMTKDGSTTSTSGEVSGKFKEQVNLTFYNLATKIRFGIYETIPGYSVKIDKFYYNSDESTTNFGVNGSFKTVPAAGTTLTVTYYDATAASVENRPKVDAGSVSAAGYGEFGTNIQATNPIGTTSIAATYDQAGGEYTYILPYTNTSGMDLKVDYTLTSTDGSLEDIHVKGASAHVPANFTDWKENFAYTYLFKISDNTNGTTGTPGVDDPGLYPITFDAVVIGEEDGIQETITSVADPSITTYQKGKVVTENDEYVAGDIFFENSALNVSGYKVYEVNNYGDIEKKITEEVVANWKNNFCVLTEVATEDASTLIPAGIPLSDGTYISKTADQAYKFTAVAGKTYVIASGDINVTTTKYKVVKIANGPAAAVNYTQSMTTATISAANGVAVYKLKSDSPKANSAVLGAAPLLKIYDSSDNDVTTNFTIAPGSAPGNYKIGLTAAAIAAGANDTYTVKFNGVGDQTFTVGLLYALTSSPVTVVKNGSTDTFILTDGTNPISDAVIKNLPTGVTIIETSTPGTYEVAATSAATAGAYTTTTVAGQALTINVDNYWFASNINFTFDYTGTAAAQTLALHKNYGDANVLVANITGQTPGIATLAQATPGTYTVVPVAPGSFTVKYENASAVITVNQYTLTPSAASIPLSTGSTTLALKKNNGTETVENASTANVEVKRGGSVVPIGDGFQLSTNGKALKFSNVSKAGVYTFTYSVGTVKVAQTTVTVPAP